MKFNPFLFEQSESKVLGYFINFPNFKAFNGTIKVKQNQFMYFLCPFLFDYNRMNNYPGKYQCEI